MNNSIISDYIFTENIPLGVSIRLDCPICNNIKTLSVTNFGDCIKYYCFHSNCNKGGVIKEGVTMHSFNSAKYITKDIKTSGLEIFKSHWRNNNFPESFLNYITDNHCVPAFLQGLADIRYDFKKNRAVFLIKNNRNKLVDAAGRSLLRNGTPKWYRYGNSSEPFICGKSEHAIVVEDCASAASVATFATGVALLGTNMSDTTLESLSKFKHITVALDLDATTKSIEHVDRIKWEVPNVDMVVLQRDLKKLSTQEAKEVLNIDDR